MSTSVTTKKLAKTTVLVFVLRISLIPKLPLLDMVSSKETCGGITGRQQDSCFLDGWMDK